MSLMISVAFSLLLGAIVGSFLNVVIHRLPRILERDWVQQCKAHLGLAEAPPLVTTAGYNFFLPRSHCPACQKTLPFYFNVPIFSFLYLKGQCAFCSTSIPKRYFLVELLTSVLFALLTWRWGLTLTTGFGFLFISFLIALTFIDAETQFLPDELTLPLLWTGLWANSQFQIFCDAQAAILGAILGYLSLWSIYWIFKWSTGKEGMGYGDFKLLAALGAWFGWFSLPRMVLIASGVGCTIGLLRIALKKHHWEHPMAFGPYLAGAGMIFLFL